MQKSLIEELFSSGLMKMGPSHADPQRQVGVFDMDRLGILVARRAAEMKKIEWIAGQWQHENIVPATRVSPAYVDAGTSRLAFSAKGDWVNIVSADGTETPNITYDPFSDRWIYVLLRGGFGILKSADGWKGDSIAFSGSMTMLGTDRDWRLTLTRESRDAFRFVNEEGDPDGTWLYIDEWRFRRKAV